MSGIPLLVEMEGLHVLVVGGGSVAERRVVALLDAGARVTVIAPAATAAIQALADSDRCRVALRAYAPEDLRDADLVIAATNDDAVNDAVSRDARAAHVLVNAAYDGRSGSVDMMAAHRAGPLVIGVSAGVPAAAARIRDALAERFDGSYGAVLSALADARRRMLESGSRQEWRTRSAELIDERFCARVEQGDVSAEVQSWP